MSTLRALRPLTRQVPRLTTLPKTTTTTTTPRRHLNTSTAPTLYTVSATAKGARNGHVTGTEGLSMDLGMPKSLGGAGERGKTNPEELFAAGYGACFQSAMGLCAQGLGIKMPPGVEDCVVETTVHMVGDMKAADLGLKVEMLVKVKGVDKGELEKLVDKTKKTCPYSRATQGNVTTDIKVETM